MNVMVDGEVQEERKRRKHKGRKGHSNVTSIYTLLLIQTGLFQSGKRPGENRWPPLIRHACTDKTDTHTADMQILWGHKAGACPPASLQQPVCPLSDGLTFSHGTYSSIHYSLQGQFGVLAQGHFSIKIKPPTFRLVDDPLYLICVDTKQSETIFCSLHKEEEGERGDRGSSKRNEGRRSGKQGVEERMRREMKKKEKRAWRRR
ncbi:unnamed protein product [Pleuronectes platessa]|uniref:Uncharacterized protein n=1 Tax=Pleuronectes platessa TaxID=8262 RepID=A0A9N7W4F7_PLEPL|nr:unnamed protein product [Pleuronectes platessa]